MEEQAPPSLQCRVKVCAVERGAVCDGEYKWLMFFRACACMWRVAYGGC